LHPASITSWISAENTSASAGRQLVAILHRPAMEVGERRQLDRPSADAGLDRPRGVGLGPAVQERHPHRPALDRADHRDAAGLVESPDVAPLALARAGCGSFSGEKPRVRSSQYQRNEPIPMW
jgi:hypothetical protein